MITTILNNLFGILLLGSAILTTNPTSTAPIAAIPSNEIAEFKPLSECKDNNLQFALEETLYKNPKWLKLISQKRLSVGLVDIRDMNNAKYASVNGDEMMYAASLPKIAILLASMDAIDKGELKETAEVKRDMKLMIAKSDNQASTRMIDRVGYKKIEAVLTDPRYKLYDAKHGGGLWVGKRYAAGGIRNPDPLKGLSHAATAEQVCRYYYMMANGQLISEERSQEMMDIMADPKLHHKFVNTLDKIAPDAKLYRKSGSWSNFHSDSVMVIGGESRKYILVALTEDPQGEQSIRKLVYAIEKALKNANKSALAIKS
jgi:beta-lactamase class A